LPFTPNANLQLTVSQHNARPRVSFHNSPGCVASASLSS
jgi:hypothetical protein